MSTIESVAIIGLGLIGGSLARDLAALGVRVSAYDPDASHIAAAIRTNVVRQQLDASLDGAGDADVVVIAAPVDAALNVLRCLASQPTRARLVTDVGSTKGRIVQLASDLGVGERFVGGHPLTGDHRSGWEASRHGLFLDARVFLCPTRETSAETTAAAEAFWRLLGAAPEHVTAGEHDLRLGWASHLPHALSASLALTLARAGVHRRDLGPGGRDVTRLAGSSPEMWAAIALDNAAALDVALHETEREIAGFRAALKQADAAAIQARFADARAWFDERVAG